MMELISPDQPMATGEPLFGGYSREEIVAQMNRMLASKSFRGSRRLSRFLRFAVEQTLGSETGRLKEYCIGVEVFEKPESFDPRMDSIVRVMARRLRLLVNAYYDTEGKDDQIEIHFDSGSYVPKFVPLRRPVEEKPASNQQESGMFIVGGDQNTLKGLMDGLMGLVEGAPSGTQSSSSEQATALVNHAMGMVAFYVSPSMCSEVLESIAASQPERFAFKPLRPEELSSVLRGALGGNDQQNASSPGPTNH
jgi:hypothetical protein